MNLKGIGKAKKEKGERIKEKGSDNDYYRE
jgi:hypothetical protein